MQLTAIPTEITLLGWAAVLFLIQLMLQANSSVLELGIPYALGARDEQRQAKGVYAARLGRAFYNLTETFPVFAALALALAVTGRSGGLAVIGAQLWFWARVAYVPLYVLGVPVARTLVWVVSIVGLVLMLIRLL